MGWQLPICTFDPKEIASVIIKQERNDQQLSLSFDDGENVEPFSLKNGHTIHIDKDGELGGLIVKE